MGAHVPRPAHMRLRGVVAPMVLIACLLAGCGGSSSTPAATAVGGNATGVPAGQNLDKVDRILLQMVAVYQSRGLDAALQFARDEGLVTKQDEVRVTLILDSDDPGIVESTALSIQRLGGRVTATMGATIEMVVPLKTLVEYGKTANKQTFFADLADFQHVQDIRRTPTATKTATPPSGATRSTGGGKSEGVALTGADQWQAAGITGKGVKVGVIDGAFNRYAEFLPRAQVTTRSFRADGLIEDSGDGEGIHGTACAEIVNEMAPDASLYLAAFDTPGEFVMAIRWLVTTVGVTVISTSIGFDGFFPLDGSSPVAMEIDRAKAAGVFFAISAGNEAGGMIGSDDAEGHFGGTFADSDSDGYHDFPGAKTKNALRVKVGRDPVRIVLNWDDWVQTHVNYDLFLYDTNGREAGRSDDDQSRGRKRPVESITGKLPPGTYELKIRKVNPNDPDLPFNIYFGGVQLEQVTAAQSLSTPADAKGAFTVAAIDVKTGQVEEFSSQGATMDGRNKPDIGGPDNNLSFAYATRGEATFQGTSAATPHVAGAAALARQAMPNATPDAVFRLLADRARPPQGTLVGDNVSGAGLLFLGTPPSAVSASPAPTRAPAVPTPAGAAILNTAGPTFTDDFLSPASGLPAAGYQSGEYRVRGEAGSLVPITYTRVVQGGSAETYEVQGRKVSGADDALFGLIIRRLDADNYLLFVITNDGLYGVFARANGSLRAVGTAGASTAIKRDAPNSLRVTTSGTTFTFAVNDQTVSRVDIADIWSQGAFGFVGGGGQNAPSEVAFRAYRVALG